MGPQNLRAIGDRIEQLLDELRAAADPRTFALAEELLRNVTELYGCGLEKIIELVGIAEPAVLDRLLAEDLVASLLLVHGLHPEALEARVERALAKVRPLLATHGGDVELLDVDLDASAVRIRLLGSCDGCPSSAATLQGAVERAINEAAPEIGVIDVEPPTQTLAQTLALPESVTVPVQLTVKPVYASCPTGIGAS